MGFRVALCAAVLLAGCAAPDSPPAPPPAPIAAAPADTAPASPPATPSEQEARPAAPPAPSVADLLALEGVRAPADPRYLDLLAEAQRDGAAITRERMIALRWAWMGSTDFNPLMPTRLARRAEPRAGNDCARARQAASAVLAVHWLDLRSHAVIATCAGREGDRPAAARHLAIRDAIIAAMQATGDGSAPERAMTVIAVDEEYALLEIIGARRTRVALAERGGRTFDAMGVTLLRSGRAITLWFDVSRLFEFYGRGARPALQRT